MKKDIDLFCWRDARYHGNVQIQFTAGSGFVPGGRHAIYAFLGAAEHFSNELGRKLRRDELGFSILGTGHYSAPAFAMAQAVAELRLLIGHRLQVHMTRGCIPADVRRRAEEAVQALYEEEVLGAARSVQWRKEMLARSRAQQSGHRSSFVSAEGQ